MKLSHILISLGIALSVLSLFLTGCSESQQQASRWEQDVSDQSAWNTQDQAYHDDYMYDDEYYYYYGYAEDTSWDQESQWQDDYTYADEESYQQWDRYHYYDNDDYGYEYDYDYDYEDDQQSQYDKMSQAQQTDWTAMYSWVGDILTQGGAAVAQTGEFILSGSGQLVEDVFTPVTKTLYFEQNKPYSYYDAQPEYSWSSPFDINSDQQFSWFYMDQAQQIDRYGWYSDPEAVGTWNNYEDEYSFYFDPDQWYSDEFIEDENYSDSDFWATGWADD
jgi:hypothetical protein